MTPTPLRLPALAALLLALMGPLNTHAQERRNEIGLRGTPDVLATDDRRSRGLAYDRDFGICWMHSGGNMQNIRLGLVFKY
jgi:hypothetical protein